MGNLKCLKCGNFFIEQHAVNCPNDFPSPATYKSLTQSDMDHGCGLVESWSNCVSRCRNGSFSGNGAYSRLAIGVVS